MQLADAQALHRAGRMAEAAQAYRAVLAAFDPEHFTVDDALALCSVAEWYVHSGKIEEIIGWLDAAVKLDDGNATLHAITGYACYRLGRWDEAEDHLLQALALQDPFPQAYGYLGHLEGIRGNWAQQGRLYRHSLAQHGDDPGTQMSMGMWYLRHGIWAKGWRLYEGRLKMPGFHGATGQASVAPEWAGEPLEGKAVLVLTEQGVGDGFMFARYLPELAYRGAAVWWAVLPGVKPLAHECADALGLAGVVAYGDLLPAVDYQVPLLSLPYRLGQPIPYFAEPYLPLPLDPVPGRVGYVMAGNPKLVNDRHRSTPPELWTPLLSDEWVSLQPGVGGFQPADWLETARRIATCERVVTVDTATAHLAGAMGVPVTMLNPANGDFRWGREGNGPNWYGPTFEVRRQPHLGDWASVFQVLYGAAQGGRDGKANPPQAASSNLGGAFVTSVSRNAGKGIV